MRRRSDIYQRALSVILQPLSWCAHLWEDSFTSAKLLKVLLSLTLFYSERGERTSKLTWQKNVEGEINLAYLNNFLLSVHFWCWLSIRLTDAIVFLHAAGFTWTVSTLAEGSQCCLLLGWVTGWPWCLLSGNHLSADRSHLSERHHY